MKAKALSVKECTWMSEECHLVDELHGDFQRDSLCLPNIFRSKKVKAFTRIQTGPTYQVYYTARELLLEVLDRGAIQELIRRTAGVKAGAKHQSREQSTDLSEEEYAEALTWFSIVLQNGLSVGENHSFGSELTLKLDRWQGVLKRNSFQTSILSVTRLQDAEKLEAISAFCSHLTRRYQALYTPSQNLSVKKYCLSYQQAPCSLYLAVLCDMSSGFICNMYLYCPEQLLRRSRKPVVEQVVVHLLRPFCSHRHLIQLDSSAWMEGKLTDIFCNLGVNIQFVPFAKRTITKSASSSSLPVMSKHQRTFEDSVSQLVAHLQGWTGPAMFLLSDLKGSVVDEFLPGLWVTLHIICINTFVLHTLQGSGRQVHLKEFTKTLASQLAVDNSVTVPVLPRLNSNSYQETSITHLPKQSSGPLMENKKQGCEKHPPGVCGLDNSGNSCYLNAVFQCLCSTVPLVEHLLNQDTHKELARCKCRVAVVFVRLLEEMWLGKSSSCAPVEARSVLCSILPQFNNHSQQDAQELLLFLLNALHDDLKKVNQIRSSIRQPRQDQNRNCATAAAESTIVSNLFEGQLSYMTLCMHCDHQAHSTQSFTVLSLPIPTDTIKCSIQDCLSLFFEQTVLTGGEQMLCSVCELRRETAVLTCLDKPPEILMLHLKRFGCKGKNQVKLRTNVVFSTKLDLTPFLSSSAQNSSCSSYSLYAVVNHTGHLNMGHYTALCRNALTRTWHSFDDSVVREIQDSVVQSPNAYMLLYSRKPLHKPKIHGL
ncbi:ubiquitin carboxyl-terminal hydrolase 2-like [Scomber scombrus]|uniref:ubiquitin carboxyl-terminal hydrolase 2-like n=1 Tax=Scomber scombrus TaxID=13677 RepID=UPI002DD7D7AA|nr:ubiquitin carboxyl-terminal hydrolase 2-like [Scomber scombrus]